MPSQVTQLCLDAKKARGDRRIMLFDMSVGGHHAGYIQHLIRYWGEQELPGRLDVVVVPKFLQQHQDVVELAQTWGSDRINFVPISEAEVAWLGPWSTFARRKVRALREWSLLNQYATALEASECVLMYFDTFQFSAWLRRPFPCPFSGLYFRSRFHYGDFQPDSLTWKDHVRHWQEHFHISQVLRHPQLKTLFCLDQFAVNYLNQSHNNAKAVYLPDPVQIYTDHEIKVEELKASLGIEPGRQVLLLFGALDRRKGIHQLLQAVLMLPASLGKKLCLLLVGPISAQDQPLVQAQINQISQLLPVQIVIHDQFVIDRDIQPFFQLSDAVLAPYQRHVGTSSILIRAAAAQKPVLSSNYGLMGEWTRHYQLGLTVDSAVPSEIAKGLTQVLEKPATELCDRHKMKLFAQQNAAERYANTIFQHVLD